MQAQRWSKERAQAWAQTQPWWVGCNFIPSTACNQLEMWQAETFDPATIERELGWAAEVGTMASVFICMISRGKPTGGIQIADRYVFATRGSGRHSHQFVLFDDCWFPPVPAPNRTPCRGA